MSSFLYDVKQALRSLLRARGFLVCAVACLALGLGANIAVMSQVDHLALRPLPFPDSQALVNLEAKELPSGTTQPMTMADFLDFQAQCRSFQGLAACTARVRTLQGLEDPLRLDVGMVTANFFQVLGVRPALGRIVFTAEEEAAPHATVVVLRHDFWAEKLGRDPGVIGRTLVLDGHAMQVVGVLPPAFKFFDRIAQSQIFTPEAISFAGRANRGMGTFLAIGRLNRGVTLGQAATEVRATAQQIARAVGNPHFGGEASSMTGGITRFFLPMVLALQVAVGLVLLLTAFNVASLQLVRNTARVRELAIRHAVGARPAQLWRLFLAESLLLALLGGAGGLGLSVLLQLVLANLLKDILPIPLQVGLYPALLGAALVLSLLTGLGLALLSALMARHIPIREALQEGSRGTFSKAHRRVLKALVVGELALSVTLLLGAGMLTRSLLNLSRVRAGFEPEQVLIARIPLPPQTYGSQETQNAFLDRLDPALRGISGVLEVGVNDTTPFVHADNAAFVGTSPDRTGAPHARIHVVTPGYFKAMGIPLLEGETFSRTARHTCILSRKLAKSLWPTGSALGRQVFFGRETSATVAAIVGDTGEKNIRDMEEPQIYRSAYETGLFEGAIASIKVQGPPSAYATTVKRAILALDPKLAVPQPTPFREAIRESYTVEASLGILFLGFGLMALFLAAVGLMGVISQTAQQRTREVGIRMSLGALPSRIALDVIREALVLVGLGLLPGALLGWALQKLMANLLYGLSSIEVSIFAGVLTLMALIAIVASLIPALRAARVNPAEALRSE